MPKKKTIKVPTTGVCDFETLVTSKKGKYVDKTDLLYEICNDADQQLFISRPRRFGKSLMLSTLKAMFEGRRDLFKGLAIDKLPWEGWKQPTPVYSFTMGDVTGENYEEVKEQLGELVEDLFQQAGIPVPEKGTIPGKFKEYATLLGYSPKELDGPLRENVEAFGEKSGMDFAAAKAAILSWYDGYRFSPRNENRVCNPVSLGRAFKDGELKGYWETTGRATLIINRIAKAGKMPGDLENVPADAMTLDVCDAETLPMEALLYQGGYLTIKNVIPPPREPDGQITQSESYVLAPPNLEVRDALKRGYLSQVMGMREGSFNPLVERARRLIASGDWKGYLYESLFGLYASIPVDWHIKDEAEAKRYFQLFTSMTGANPQPEVASIFGYADAVIETPANVFVFEFKYRKSAKAAIRQIRERGYADKWIGGKRPVTLIGINFNPKKRNIDMPIVEPA